MNTLLESSVTLINSDKSGYWEICFVIYKNNNYTVTQINSVIKVIKYKSDIKKSKYIAV